MSMKNGIIINGIILRGYRLRNLENEERNAAANTRLTGSGKSATLAYRSSTTEKHAREHCKRGVNLPDVGKLDYENRRGKNATDVCRCQQRESNLIFSTRKQQQQQQQQTRHKMSREPEERTGSVKSEEEAATTIQAIYRGYKARRRFDEIKKSTSDEKRNIKKVAELLAIPMDEMPRNPSKETVRISSSLANQIRNEKDDTLRSLSPRKKTVEQSILRNKHQRFADDQLDHLDTCSSAYDTQRKRILQNALNQREMTKSIRTIKSPVFFSNHDEKTSSLSDNTDTDDPASPRTDAKSTATDFDEPVAIDENVTKNDATNYQGGDNPQRLKSGVKSVQIRSSNYKRPLPQRISSSMLSSNPDGYYFDNSLFFPDRESILVFGGVDPHEDYGHTENTGKDIYRFKPDENNWEFVGVIPQPRHHHSVAYLRGRIYLVGGADPLEDKLHRKSTAVGSMWSYDPTTRTWFNEPGMLTARKDFGLVVSHGKMYAIGGQSSNGIALKTIEAFDPLDSTWREMQPMQTARVGPASVKYKDLIWVAGGMTKSKKELFSKEVECYDPMKNLWLKTVPLRSPRCFASFYVVSDCLYMIGGASTTENGTQSVDSIDVWNANDCVWKEHANMSIARHGHTIGSIGDQLLIIGGVTTVFMKTLNSVECYCCDIQKWMKGVTGLPHPVSGHGTVSLPAANLLIDH